MMRWLRSGTIVVLVSHFFLHAEPAGATPGSDPRLELLLSTMVTWLSVNFGLPADYNHPAIAWMPAKRISDIRYGTVEQRNRREVVAVYNDATRTIVLTETWAGKTPAELSVLLHEVVHHLQKISDLSYKCPGAREKLAYAAQQRWLSMFGSNLYQTFGIDALTLKLLTECM